MTQVRRLSKPQRWTLDSIREGYGHMNTKNEYRKRNLVPHFLDKTSSSLLEFWRRMLTNSRDDLPCSLVLVESRIDSEEVFIVIGHGRIGHVLGLEDAFWIKSVVVRKDLRGRGFGKLLMSKIEDYAKHRGYGCSYLTTYDRQGFYGGIGYEFCQPVCFIGHSFSADKLMTSKREKEAGVCHTSAAPLRDAGPKSLKPLGVHPAPPPPPPLPSSTHPPTGRGNDCPGSLNEKTWMRKLLFT